MLRQLRLICCKGLPCRFAGLLVSECDCAALLRRKQGKGRHEEAALRAAELVLGNKLVPINGSSASEV